MFSHLRVAITYYKAYVSFLLVTEQVILLVSYNNGKVTAIVNKRRIISGYTRQDSEFSLAKRFSRVVTVLLA